MVCLRGLCACSRDFVGHNLRFCAVILSLVFGGPTLDVCAWRACVHVCTLLCFHPCVHVVVGALFRPGDCIECPPSGSYVELAPAGPVAIVAVFLWWCVSFARTWRRNKRAAAARRRVERSDGSGGGPPPVGTFAGLPAVASTAGNPHRRSSLRDGHAVKYVDARVGEVEGALGPQSRGAVPATASAQSNGHSTSRPAQRRGSVSHVDGHRRGSAHVHRPALKTKIKTVVSFIQVGTMRCRRPKGCSLLVRSLV